MLAAMRLQGPLDDYLRLNRRPGVLESDEKAISGVSHLLAAVLSKGRPKDTIVPSKQLLPGGVSDHADQIGRGYELGEHECLGGSPAVPGRTRMHHGPHVESYVGSCGCSRRVVSVRAATAGQPTTSSPS
jgi:hypothetical protein